MSPLDPERRFQNETRRRLPQIEFGTRIPVLRAALDGTIAVGQASETEITWGTWDNNDDRYFGVTTSGGRLRQIELLIPGRYSVFYSLQFDSGGWLAGDPLLLILFNDFTDSIYLACRTGHAYLADTFNLSFSMQMTRSFPDYLTPPGGLTLGMAGRLLCKASQANSGGGSKDATDGFLEIGYDGPIYEQTEEP